MIYFFFVLIDFHHAVNYLTTFLIISPILMIIFVEQLLETGTLVKKMFRKRNSLGLLLYLKKIAINISAVGA